VDPLGIEVTRLHDRVARLEAQRNLEPGLGASTRREGSVARWWLDLGEETDGL
jgi:hypothetical protein